MRTFVERDATPPQVWVRAPAGVISGAFTVTWGATDAQAGVAWYDLDVSVDGGPWQRVLTQTPITNYQYTNPPNTHVTFRVTATDHVSNAASTLARTSVVRVTKYYYHGGARVALRTSGAGGSVVYWLHGDHLGSVTLLTDYALRVTAQQRFLPYGGVRYSEGTFPTDVGFTGHRGHPDLGLIYMRARYYHSGLGRFVSADTVVPQPGNPQDLNRYTYVRNNPLAYVDPSGHSGEPPDPQKDYVGWLRYQWQMHGLFSQYSFAQFRAAYEAAVLYAGSVSGEQMYGWAFATGMANYLEGTQGAQETDAWYNIKLAAWVWHSADQLLIAATQDMAIRATVIGGMVAFSTLAENGRAAGAISSVPEDYAGYRFNPRNRQLYRGFNPDNPVHAQQLDTYYKTGAVQPRGGEASLTQHVNAGRTQSPFTSWTLDPAEAWRWAGPRGTVLTVNEAEITNLTFDSYLWSDFPWEQEVTIKGPVYGATVYR